MTSLVFNGIQITGMGSLLEILKDSDIPKKWVISDLSLGAWNTDQIVSEFSSQLGISYTPTKQMSAKMSERPNKSSNTSYSDIIGEVIDLENRGNYKITGAFTHIKKILDASKNTSITFLVIIPFDGLPWGDENIEFLQLFSQILTKNSTLFLVRMDDIHSKIPKDWKVEWLISKKQPKNQNKQNDLFTLFPGLVDSNVIASIKLRNYDASPSLFPLGHGIKLVAPELRQDPKRISKLEYDKFALQVQPIGWLKAYAQYFGSNYFVDPVFLFNQSWEMFLQGNYEIAIKLTSKAISCTTIPLLKTSLHCFLQGMRIASQKFDEIVNDSTTTETYSMEFRKFLLQAKGWGLVMLDKPIEAESYFSQARILNSKKDKKSLEYLYLLNISALNRFKLGDLHGALAMEKEVENNHALLSQKDWRLEYVNTINTARLYRVLENFDLAEQYYNRAFLTTLGARTENDLIYSNVCIGKLEEAKKSHIRAFMNWVRASLHWISYNTPEALARRVTIGILDHPLPPNTNLIESVSQRFIEKLLNLASASKLNLYPKLKNVKLGQNLPMFIRSDFFPQEMLSEKTKSCFALPGASIIISNLNLTHRINSPNYQKLCSMLFELLKLVYPSKDFTKIQTIIIDDDLGYDVPDGIPEILGICIRLNLSSMVYGKNVIEIDDNLHLYLERKSHIKFTDVFKKIVTSECKPYVTFKRYYAPKIISDEETKIITCFNHDISIEHLEKKSNIKFSNLIILLRKLEKERIIKIYLPHDLDYLKKLNKLFVKLRWEDL